MTIKQILFTFSFLLVSIPAFSYKIEGGEYYVGGGFGANVNVVRYDVPKKETPRAELPLFVNLDYAIDQNIGFFGTFSPHFGAGSIAFGFLAGAKYRFTFLDAPYVPYVSLALAPTFLFPMTSSPSHVNFGLSPGAGMNFFVMAKLLVGAHVLFNPSIAFIDGAKKFEFAVTTFFDVSLRV